MPQLDFRQALSSPTDPVFPVMPPGKMEPANFADPYSGTNQAPIRSRPGFFARSDWTTFVFALLVFSGGLFCAFYFFNGVDLVRTIAAWPSELLYARPPAMTQTAKIDMFHRGSELESGFAAASRTHSSDGSTTPFGPSVGSLNPNLSSSLATPNPSGNVPSIPIPAPPPSPSDTLLGLNVLPPGADALSRAFAQAVTDLARPKINDAKQIIVQLSRRTHARLKTAKQQLAATKVTSKQVTQNVQQNSRLTGATQISARVSTATPATGSFGLQGVGGAGGVGGGGGLGGRLPVGLPAGLSGGHH